MMIDRWSASTRSTRGFSALRLINAPPSATSPEMKITVWDLVPHRKMSKTRRVYKTRRISGLNTLPIYGRLNTHYINYIKYISICIRLVGAAWACVALPRGPECHVASRWDPHEKLNAFCHFFNYFKRFKSKIKSDKSRKIPKNCKIHNFQNITPN